MGVMLYLVLWLVLPLAITTAEKLESKGKKVDAQSIKEHFKNFQKDMEGLGSEKSRQKFKTAGEQLLGSIGKVLGLGALILGSFLAIVLVYWVFTKDFLISITNTGIHGLSMADFMRVSLTDLQHSLVTLGVILLLAGPILGLFTLAVRLYFKLQRKLKTVAIISAVSWVLGIVLLTMAGISISRDRSSSHTERESIAISSESDVLHLDIAEDIHFSDEYTHTENYFFELIQLDGDSVRVGWPKLDIFPSETGEFELKIYRTADGRNLKEAVDNAKGIVYPVEVLGNKVIVSPYFSFDLESRYREQDITVILKVPNGKAVQLSNRMARVLHKVDNEFDLDQHKLAGKRWTMHNDELTPTASIIHRRGPKPMPSDSSTTKSSPNN